MPHAEGASGGRGAMKHESLDPCNLTEHPLHPYYISISGFSTRYTTSRLDPSSSIKPSSVFIQIQGYCEEATRCRHAHLMEYFGEASCFPGGRCPRGCDNCERAQQGRTPNPIPGGAPCQPVLLTGFDWTEWAEQVRLGSWVDAAYGIAVRLGLGMCA